METHNLRPARSAFFILSISKTSEERMMKRLKAWEAKRNAVWLHNSLRGRTKSSLNLMSSICDSATATEKAKSRAREVKGLLVELEKELIERTEGSK